MRASAELEVEPGQSWMIGDDESDVAAGRAAGCSTILIAPEGDDPPPPTSSSRTSRPRPAGCADLADTAQGQLRRRRQRRRLVRVRHGGAVVSTTIDKYVYVAVNKRFEESTRVSYSRTEIVDSIDELEHELAREALRAAGIPRGTEIVTIADVPSEGTGLGSSSAVTVGLLNALFAYQGILKSPGELAEEAARIEIDVLGKPIGKQDQYAAAFGGLQLLEFGPGTASGGRRSSSPRGRRRRWAATC